MAEERSFWFSSGRLWKYNNTRGVEAVRCCFATLQIAIKTDSRSRRRIESDIYSALKIFCTVSYQHKPTEAKLHHREGSGMVWTEATGGVGDGDETTRTASSWHSAPSSPHFVRRESERNNDAFLLGFDYVAKSAHAYDILWYSYGTNVTPGGRKKAQTFAPCVNEFLKAKKKKKKTKENKSEKWNLDRFNGGKVSLTFTAVTQTVWPPSCNPWPTMRLLDSPRSSREGQAAATQRAFLCKMWEQGSHARTRPMWQMQWQEFRRLGVKLSASFYIFVGTCWGGEGRGLFKARHLMYFRSIRFSFRD